MEPLYEPKGVEERWQRVWEDEGLYSADPDPSRESFVIALPPPNVTGELHMGHALNGALQDVLVRSERMRGRNALWQPGYDHAGIATQNVVEKQLAKEGKTRHDLGREAFVARVWEWLETYGRVIMRQYRRLGASLDYRRERFTMDPAYVRAVLRFFVHLYERGLIYRDNRMINWCPRCATAISDLEVDHHERDETLFYVRYPLAEGGGHVTIATVRPPTMLADVAVAVHPEDERYRSLVGKNAIVPVAERRVPVIADERIEPEFGTGAVKITPGHDPVDFEIGREHGLPEPMVIGLDGRMNALAGELEGLSQEEAEARIVEILRERGLLERQEPYRHSVGHCERCGTRVEPLISLQWFCEMKELAAPAIEAVASGSVRFTPDRFENVYLGWMEAIRPWCISRQLWWGHRIPVWYCADGHATVAAETAPEGCGECGSGDLLQDDDVLDTWFSSALWPFATLGWPEETPDLDAFYPGDVLVTGREIIFLWVARMVMSGLELLGEPPFHDVIINSTVLAPDGRRMSKSLGTGIDPLEMVERYGADATRYGLLKMSSTQDVRFSIGFIQEGRKLANKLWNVSRLILANAGRVDPDVRPTSIEERWILARIERTRAEVEENLSAFAFAPAVNALYHLTFDEFCDWYAEAIKPRLYGGDEDVRATALAALARLLKLLHPVIPHVTEEIWSHLPARETPLIVAPWPEEDRRFGEAEEALERVQDVAAIYRRSGVLVELEGEERRIFDAVVRPGAVGVDGNRDAEVERLRREIARAEGMLANERFVSRAPPDVVAGEREKLVRYRRELDALGG
ncbi:MAG: valine--tRNA ligase [Actinomycetota bacterium]|nr:valine--tRNA ligase [Actinomycetota bacterium]